MDYKRIIKSRRLREKILDLLVFVPDKMMLKLQYYVKTGRVLDLNNPVRFTEKLQWYKINYRNPVLHKCVDKFQVRKYLKSKGLENILVKLYGKYDSLNDINWEDLPDRFVIKNTNGGGGLNVLICNDKKLLNLEDIREKISLKEIKYQSGGREWAYYGLKPSVIIEELLINEKNPAAGVNDYKIFCFNGKAKFIVVDVERYIGHKRNFYDTKWNNLEVVSDCPKSDIELEKPNNLNEMLTVAEKLSSDFPFVRVDLYNVNNKIYFGELTFYPWSGYVQFDPDSYDFELGKNFILP